MKLRSWPCLLMIVAPLAVRALPAPHLFDTDPPRPPAPVALRHALGGLDTPPVSIAHAGDDRLFLALLEGLVVVVEQGAVRPEPFLDIRSLVTLGGPGAHSGEQGLLGIAFHPRYAENGFFFVDYTDRLGTIVVARYRVSSDPQRADPESGRILLTIPKPYINHNGGQLQFGPDGYLYVSVGDGGSAGGPSCFSQRNDFLLGKLLRIDVDANAELPPYHGIPAGNPFPGSLIWASGLRNPWRFSFDRLTGDLWIADVGEKGREEIDVQLAGTPGGLNYGWKPMEGSSCFSWGDCPVGTPQCGSPSLVLPVLEYDHRDGECSITGGYVSRSPALPHLWGSYFFADLCSGRIWTADSEGDNWNVRQLPQPLQGVVTFGEDRTGRLWLATHQGDLYELFPQLPVDTPGLYAPDQARFLFKDLFLDGPEDRSVRFGRPRSAWLPLAGDWDGDGRTTIGFWDPAARTFRLKNNLQTIGADLFRSATPPSSRSLPLAGDWDGDGRDTVGFYDRVTSTFHLTNRYGAVPLEIVFAFGQGGRPVVGDWDGDGRDSVGLFVSGRVFVLRNELSAGPADHRVRFGTPQPGWLPVAGDWDGDGDDAPGLFDPATATFHLLDTLQEGPADHVVRFGTPGAGQVPLAGEW